MFADAAAYDRFMGRWSRLVAPRFVDFARLPDRGRLLDVGSGTGALASAMAQRHPEARIVGIDPSREFVACAVAGNSYPDRAGFEVGDAQRLHFDRASFDGAASLLVFNFIPDPVRALLELRRVTKPGGGISAAVWDYGAGMRMLRVFWDAAVSVDPDAEELDERHMPLCRAGELSALWKQGGLDHVREQAIDIEMRFESFADYGSHFSWDRARPVRTLAVLAAPGWTPCVAKPFVCLVCPGKRRLLLFPAVYGRCAASFRAALSRLVCGFRLLRHETRGTHRPSPSPSVLPPSGIRGPSHSPRHSASCRLPARPRPANATSKGTRPSSRCRPDPASDLRISPTSARRTPSDLPPSIFRSRRAPRSCDCRGRGGRRRQLRPLAFRSRTPRPQFRMCA